MHLKTPISKHCNLVSYIRWLDVGDIVLTG